MASTRRYRSTQVLALVALGVAMPTALAAAPNGPALRPDQPEVLAPPPPPQRPAVPDFAGEFRQRYQHAGAPRIMLLWNQELSARAGQEWVVRVNEQASGSRTFSSLKQSTTGSSDNSTLTEGGGQAQTQKQRETSVGQREDAKRSTALSERNAAQLLRSFESHMRDGGARLIDHALSVRGAAVAGGGTVDSADVNTRTLEATAVRKNADMLLQVLLVPDDKSTLGYGFDVSVREVANGTVVASFYTRAVPRSPPSRQVYTATEKGFESRTVSQGHVAIADVGVQLADEVMNQLGPVLPSLTKR